MDAWDPNLAKSVAHQLTMPDAPRTPLRAFLELWHSFVVTSAYLREKPLAECMTALQQLLEAQPAIPRAVRGCLQMSAPPTEALSAAVTVASALYAGEITEALVARVNKSMQSQTSLLARGQALVEAVGTADRAIADDPETMKTYLNVYLPSSIRRTTSTTAHASAHVHTATLVALTIIATGVAQTEHASNSAHDARNNAITASISCAHPPQQD